MPCGSQRELHTIPRQDQRMNRVLERVGRASDETRAQTRHPACHRNSRVAPVSVVAAIKTRGQKLFSSGATDVKSQSVLAPIALSPGVRIHAGPWPPERRLA
jgi:hypothetical protein